MNATAQITPSSKMQEVLAAYPGAQRALFKRYHIGGCSSCSFQPGETLDQVCRRNNGLNVQEVLDWIRHSHEEDEKILVSPAEVRRWRAEEPNLRILDVRSRQEYEAVHIEGSVLMSQSAMQEIMARWPRGQSLVIVDHQGKSALDAAAYFAGHGFEKVRCIRGGIDAWAQEVEPDMPRYTLG